MTRLDWIALGIMGVAALGGLRRGLVGTVLSLAGLTAGAILGARLAPHFLDEGARSPYTPLVGLAGAIVGALVLQALALTVASFARGGLRLVPPLHALDSFGGLFAGAVWGAVLVWVGGAVALQLPGQTDLRREVQRSEVLQRLNEIAPPRDLLRALARFDAIPAITGPAPPSVPPDPAVLDTPAVEKARPSVVKITATACGLGVEGSGWVADPHRVVTAAHVVAGASGIEVDGEPAQAYALDRANDVAVLDVPGLDARPLPFGDPSEGQSVAILGYPENGPFDARAGRIGVSATAIVTGRPRQVTAFSGLVRHGNSGGPAVDDSGVVRATVFAARVGAEAGYGIPADAVRAALADARRPVATGAC